MKKGKKRKAMFFTKEDSEYRVYEIGKIYKSFIDVIKNKCVNDSEIENYYVYDSFFKIFEPLSKGHLGETIICVDYDKENEVLKVIVARCSSVESECKLIYYKFPRYA